MGLYWDVDGGYTGMDRWGYTGMDGWVYTGMGKRSNSFGQFYKRHPSFHQIKHHNKKALYVV